MRGSITIGLVLMLLPLFSTVATACDRSCQVCITVTVCEDQGEFKVTDAISTGVHWTVVGLKQGIVAGKRGVVIVLESARSQWKNARQELSSAADRTSDAFVDVSASVSSYFSDLLRDVSSSIWALVLGMLLF